MNEWGKEVQKQMTQVQTRSGSQMGKQINYVPKLPPTTRNMWKWKKTWKSNKLRRILTCDCDAPQNRNDMSSFTKLPTLFVYRKHIKPPRQKNKLLTPFPIHTIIQIDEKNCLLINISTQKSLWQKEEICL